MRIASMTESATADLTQDCPQCAAVCLICHQNGTIANKKDAEAAVPGRNFDAASAGVWGLHYESLLITLFNVSDYLEFSRRGVEKY